MMNSLVFIGNGFDVAHGFKTRYKDFYSNCDELNKLANNDNLLCQHILDNIKGDMWQDLECGLFEYSKMLTAQHNEGDKVSSERFKKEFQELRNALFYYIKNATNASISSNPGRQVALLSKEWSQLNYQIVSFNYSAIVASYTTDLKSNSSGLSFNPNKLIYQHGSIYNFESVLDNAADKIVLGIDDSQRVEKAHSFLYKSTQNIYNIYDLLKKMEDKAVFIVYGCSMGDSDAFYFRNLFDEKKRDRTLIIYGYGKDGVDSIKEKVFEYANGLNNYIANTNNEVFFIDCNAWDALSKTQTAIDKAVRKNNNQ